MGGIPAIFIPTTVGVEAYACGAVTAQLQTTCSGTTVGNALQGGLARVRFPLTGGGTADVAASSMGRARRARTPPRQIRRRQPRPRARRPPPRRPRHRHRHGHSHADRHATATATATATSTATATATATATDRHAHPTATPTLTPTPTATTPPAPQRLYVADQTSNSITTFDVSSLAPTNGANTGPARGRDRPPRPGEERGRTRLFVANGTSNSVTTFDISSGTPTTG